MSNSEFSLSSEQTDILEKLLKIKSNPNGISMREAVNNSFKKLKEIEAEEILKNKESPEGQTD